MPVLAILYPSPSLAELGDPVPVPEGEYTLANAVDRAQMQLKPLLETLTRPYDNSVLSVDESWYWAAPILLDLRRHGESTRKWFGRGRLASLWNGEEDDQEEGSRWADHVVGSEKACKHRNRSSDGTDR